MAPTSMCPIVVERHEEGAEAQTKPRCPSMRLATFLTPDGAERAPARSATIASSPSPTAPCRDRLATGDRTPADGEDRARRRDPARPRAATAGDLRIGLNYAAHAAETGMELPEQPIVFMKLPSSRVPPARPVEVPAGRPRLDYEAELASSSAARGDRGLRRRRRRLRPRPPAARAAVDARQGLRRLCPWGPWITTADEVADAEALRIGSGSTARCARTRRTADLIFGRRRWSTSSPRRSRSSPATSSSPARRGRRHVDGPAAVPRLRRRRADRDRAPRRDRARHRR